MATVFTSLGHWTAQRPGTLVIACSDGRLQQCLDGFLEASLGISDFDRLLLPGGPGALVPGVSDFLRSEAHREEYAFLMKTHAIERVVMLFHGPAAGGPVDAICSDYCRKLGFPDARLVAQQQELDAADLIRASAVFAAAQVSVFRAEVLPDARVQFVELPGQGGAAPVSFRRRPLERRE